MLHTYLNYYKIEFLAINAIFIFYIYFYRIDNLSNKLYTYLNYIVIHFFLNFITLDRYVM